MNFEEIKFFPFSSIEKFSKFSFLIAIILYIIGLIITNIYLSRFGIYDISLLQVQYILTGFVFLIFFLAPILGILFPFIIIFKFSKPFFINNDKRTSIIIVVFLSKLLLAILFSVTICLTLGLLFSFLLSTTVDRDSLNCLLNIRAILFFFISLSLGLIIIIYVAHSKNYLSKKFGKNMLKYNIILGNVIICVFAIFCFISILTLYPIGIHSHVHNAFSGGKPISAYLLISQNDISVIKSLGLSLDSKNYVLDTKIIHQTHSLIYLLPEKKDLGQTYSIAIPKEIVKGIIFFPDRIENSYKENNEK